MVDLSGVEEAGTYELPLQVDVPSGYELTEEARVAVRVEEAGAQETEAEE